MNDTNYRDEFDIDDANYVSLVLFPDSVFWEAMPSCAKLGPEWLNSLPIHLLNRRAPNSRVDYATLSVAGADMLEAQLTMAEAAPKIRWLMAYFAVRGLDGVPDADAVSRFAEMMFAGRESKPYPVLAANLINAVRCSAYVRNTWLDAEDAEKDKASEPMSDQLIDEYYDLTDRIARWMRLPETFVVYSYREYWRKGMSQ